MEWRVTDRVLVAEDWRSRIRAYLDSSKLASRGVYLIQVFAFELEREGPSSLLPRRPARAHLSLGRAFGGCVGGRKSKTAPSQDCGNVGLPVRLSWSQTTTWFAGSSGLPRGARRFLERCRLEWTWANRPGCVYGKIRGRRFGNRSVSACGSSRRFFKRELRDDCLLRYEQGGRTGGMRTQIK